MLFDPKDIKQRVGRSRYDTNQEYEVLYLSIISIMGGVHTVKVKTLAKPTVPPPPQDIFVIHRNNLSFT